MSEQPDHKDPHADRRSRAARHFRLVAIALDDPSDAHTAFTGIAEALDLTVRPTYSMGPGGRRLHVRLPPVASVTRSEPTVVVRLRANARLATKTAAVVVDGRMTDSAGERNTISDLDEIVDWLLATGRRTIVGADDVRPAFVLDRLRLLASDMPELLRGRVRVLQAFDQSGRTDYLTTLAAYFDHGGDIARAADSMFMHPNTVRYRLRRMRELTGLDLDDPTDRFVAEFQLRLIRLDRGDASTVPGAASKSVR